MVATFASVRQAHNLRGTFAMEPPRLSRIASPAGDRVGNFKGRLKADDWQRQAYEHAESIGELGYVLVTMTNSLADGALVVVEYDELGRPIEPDKDDQGRIIPSPIREKSERVLNALRGPTGDHHALLATAGMHDQIAGEAILLGSEVPDDGGTSWEMLSVLEIVQGTETGSDGKKKVVRKRSQAKTGSLSPADSTDAQQVLDDDTYMTRYVHPSLAYSGDPTSVLKRNQAVCREIVLLDQLKETMIESRLSAGIIFVPEEVTFPVDDEGINDITESDRFLEILMEHIIAPVKDRSNPAALGPLVVRVPADFIEKFRLFSLTDGHLDLAAVEEARARALHRLAAGLDLPIERMQGLGGTSHWNAAGIEADEVRKHIIPLGRRLARFFTEFYLRRMLVEFEDATEDEAATVAFEYDASELLARSDMSPSADTLWEDGLISNDARVKAHGFDPDEVRPSEFEKSWRVVKQIAAVPHTNNRVLLGAIIDWEELGIPPEVVDKFLSPPPPQVVVAPPNNNPEGQPPPDEQDEEEELPPPPEGLPEPAAGEPGTIDREAMAVFERIRTVSSMVVIRTLEKAATQVVSASRRLPDDKQSLICRAPRVGPRKPEVLALLSDDDWAAIGKKPHKMIEGSFDDLERMVSLWLSDLFVGWRHSERQSQLAARRAAAQLVDQLAILTLDGFKRPLVHDPAATGLVVPLGMVVDTVGAVLASS